MAYSVNVLTTVADCDTLLADAESELKALRHRADNLDYTRDSTSEASAETQAAIVSLNAKINALNMVIPTLTAGTKARKNNEIDLRSATFRRSKLSVTGKKPAAL